MDENQIKNALVDNLVEFGYNIKTFDDIINDDFYRKFGKAVLIQSKGDNPAVNNLIDLYIIKYFKE